MEKFGIVLAAGKGTRMKSLDSNKSKVAFEILGKALVDYVLDALQLAEVNETVVITGFGGEETTRIVESRAKTAVQKEINGTGKAVETANIYLDGKPGTTIVMCGDTPLITGDTVKALFDFHIARGNDMTVATMGLENPRGYGRIIRGHGDEILAIREHKDCSESELGIHEVNSGLYVFDNELLFKYLKEIKPNNSQNEYYLTDIVEIFNKNNKKVGAFVVDDAEEMFGINDRKQLAYAAKVIQDRINDYWMVNGVTLQDPRSTYIGPEVTIEPDTIIGPNTSILGNSRIGKANFIGPNSYLLNAVIGDNNKVLSSWLTDFTCGNENEIGPFTKTRAGTVLENNCRVGNFVELKDAHFHNGVKCAHLTYIGDAEVGEKTNIGCGTITANYDGFNKTRTSIGKECFVGSGTIMVAPITLEDQSFTAAGSTITKNVPTDTMSIARARQVDLEHGYTIFRTKAKAKKEAALAKKEGK